MCKLNGYVMNMKENIQKHSSENILFFGNEFNIFYSVGNISNWIVIFNLRFGSWIMIILNYYIQVVITMANINNTSSYMDEDKKQIIKESNYIYRNALEVSAFLISINWTYN